MNSVFHQYPSVGKLTKSILEVNPDLNVHEIIQIIRQSTRRHEKEVFVDEGSEHKIEYGAEFVDEQLALRLAQSALRQK